MDWQTVASAILGSGAVMAAIGYILKTAIERSLDVRLEKIRAQNKAELEEYFRRQAFVWNSQFEAAKSLLALIYRFRNTFAELTSLKSVGRQEDARTQRELFNRLETYGKDISEILYEERAILSPVLFEAAHELKTPLAELHMIGDSYFRGRGAKQSRSEPINFEADLKNLYSRIDGIYSTVVEIVHETIGVGGAEKRAFNPVGRADG
jgi:signal transduction histidine kinase